jgi:hypothetical protein
MQLQDFLTSVVQEIQNVKEPIQSNILSTRVNSIEDHRALVGQLWGLERSIEIIKDKFKKAMQGDSSDLSV